MQRVMIIGCSGAGKSTLSKKLHDITQLPIIHLDQHYWKPNWQEMEKTKWKELVFTLADRPAWIIDGNYGGTMDIRLKRADTIIFLHYTTLTCLWRVTKRTLQHINRSRADMAEGCKERFNIKFYQYVANYNKTRTAGILKKLDELKGQKQVFIFKNDKEANQFLGSLKRTFV